MTSAQKIIEESEKDRKKVKKQKLNMTISKSDFDKLKESEVKISPPKKPPKKKPPKIKKAAKIRKPFLKPKINNFKLRVKNFFIKFKIPIGFIKSLFLYSIAYGAFLSIIMVGVFKIEFGLFTIPGYGLLFYLIKEELPRIWRRFFPSR